MMNYGNHMKTWERKRVDHHWCNIIWCNNAKPKCVCIVQFGSSKKKSSKVTWIGTHVVKQGVQAANGDKEY